MSDVNATLQERGDRYGTFVDHARVTQNIKRAFQTGRNYDSLPADRDWETPRA